MCVYIEKGAFATAMYNITAQPDILFSLFGMLLTNGLVTSKKLQ